MEAIRTLDHKKEIDVLESKGIIHALRYQKDLEEAASAYKDISEVLANESTLRRLLRNYSR